MKKAITWLTFLVIGVPNLINCSKVDFSSVGDVSNTPLDCNGNASCEGQYEKASEEFLQHGDAPAVDILFVIDNSASMYEEQQKLGDRIRSFIGEISQLDWQIAFTTTDVSDGSFGIKGSFLPLEGASGNIITKATPNYESVFLNTATRPESNCDLYECASGDEMPMLASILAMRKSTNENNAFFRDKADLVVVYLSDEDENSVGGPDTTQGSDVVNTVNEIFGAKKSFSAYAIIVEPGDKKCEAAGVASPQHMGNNINSVVQLTHGVTGSICDNDYGKSLSKIGQKVRQLADRVELSELPLLNTVTVSLEPKQNINFTVNGKFVLFKTPPEEGTKIVVNYKRVKDKKRDRGHHNSHNDNDDHDNDAGDHSHDIHSLSDNHSRRD